MLTPHSMKESQAAVAAVEQELREAALLGQQDLAIQRRFRVVPQQYHKVLHLIRHGEGFHNGEHRQSVAGVGLASAAHHLSSHW